MPHFRVDDALHSHPKARRAGFEALGMWACAGSFCMAYLTDGFVPEWWVRNQPRGMTLAKKLIAAGLWHGDAEKDGEKGFQFHEFVGPGRQDSKQQVEANREKARLRKAKQRGSQPDSQPESRPKSHEVSRRDSGKTPGYTQPNPTQQENSGHQTESATDPTARDSIAATPGADLVRRTIPAELPSATRTMLRISASTLIREGTPADVVEEALRDWAAKTGVGPGILPSLAADVIKRRNGHARAAPTGPRHKVRTAAELAQRERAREQAELAAAKELQ